MKPQPIFEPDYWKDRLDRAQRTGTLHHSIFIAGEERWKKIEELHRTLLFALTYSDSKILDAGCGYGRLLDLMPKAWKGEYVGVDLCPHFVSLAHQMHPGRVFMVADMRMLPLQDQSFDWGVMISIRPMIIRNAGQEEWDKCEAELRRVCKKLMFLEYSEDRNDSSWDRSEP